MIRSNTTAIADASPTFWLVCAILFMLIKYVAVPLEPPVITNGCSNALSAPVMDKITFSVTIVLMLGSMICTNC